MDLEALVTARVAAVAPGATRLLVAVSGGADSVAALRLLHESSYSIVAAHLDHGLRAESADDATFVRELCGSLGVELHERAVAVDAVAKERGWNVEDAARRIRYSHLHRSAVAAGADVIVVAHTLDDNAETFLHQVLRGAAYPSGIPARRGMVIRPLLGVRRSVLRDYLVTAGQTWREDPTNLDVTRARAWLRSEVMPLLDRRYPGVAVRVARAASAIGDARRVIEDQVAARFGEGPLRVTALSRAPRALQRGAIAALLERGGVSVDTDLIEAVMEAVRTAALDPHAGPWRRSVADGQVVRVAYGIVSVARVAAGALEAPVPVPDLDAWRAAVPSVMKAGVTAADLPDEADIETLASTHDDLVLRHRARGDRVRLPGGSKLLSDLLIDRKVPREERDALVVLASGEDVLWVAGVPLGGARSRDQRFMDLALEQARAAADAGELPVGAVLVRDDQVVAVGRNRGQETGDPSAHAEVEVMRTAGVATGDWRLTDATLYVTLEPCPMCFGAVLQTRVARVVYGASNPREGALGGVLDLRAGRWKRTPVVEGGVRERECAALLTSFFAALRAD